MSNKKDIVWVVEEQATSSWSGEFTDDTFVVSIHRTKDGAEKLAKALRLDKAVQALTSHEIDEVDENNLDADAILGAIDNSEIADDLRQEAAKPGAVFIEAIRRVIEKHEIEIASVTVNSRPIVD